MDTQRVKFVNGIFKYYFTYSKVKDSLNIAIKHCEKGYTWKTDITEPLFVAKLELDGCEKKSLEYKCGPFEIIRVFRAFQELPCELTRGFEITFPNDYYSEKQSLAITMKRVMDWGCPLDISGNIYLNATELTVEDNMSHKIKKMKRDTKKIFIMIEILIVVMLCVIAFSVSLYL